MWLASTYEGNEATIADVARADVERALALEPELPEALAARGLYFTYVVRDPAAGLEDLMRSIALAPNDPDTHNAAGLTLRRLGRFDAALEQFRAAMELAPKEPSFGFRTHETLANLGRIDEAREVSQALQRRFPDLPYTYFHPYWYRCLQGGDLTGWREEIERWAPQLSPDDLAGRRRRFLTLHRRPRRARRAARAGVRRLGDCPGSRLSARRGLHGARQPRRARPHLAWRWPRKPTRTPDDAWAQIHGAVALELLGQRAAALAAADEAARLSAQSYDAVNGPLIAVERAWVLIRSGSRAREGYAELERWLGGYTLQPGDVAKEPLWLILRDDARVQQIFAAAMEKQARLGTVRSTATLPAPAGDHPP